MGGNAEMRGASSLVAQWDPWDFPMGGSNGTRGASS